MMLKVHVIDDDVAVRRTLISALEESGQWILTEDNFPGLKEQLLSVRPDLVVLDLVEEGEACTGNVSFDDIRSTWFCPVVVYSAFPDEQTFAHPLVRTVKKGSDSECEVKERLEELVPQAQMIRCVHKDFDLRIREALRDSVSSLSEQVTSPTLGEDTGLPRAVRRLVAARVDASESESDGLRAWERFIIPPLGQHLLTADLLRVNSAEPTDADGFRLVLTPSCDLVEGQGEAVGEVLVACCEPMRRLGNIVLSPGNGLNNKQRNRLKPLLTEGLAGSLIPIPAFRGHLPPMAANLKRLQLIGRDRITLHPDRRDQNGSGPTFSRVASTDSPFREMVVWAYLRVTGRPGLPNTDVDGWLDDISEQLTAEAPR